MPTFKTEKKTSPHSEIIELSGESHDEEDPVDVSGLCPAQGEEPSSCMFPGTSQLVHCNSTDEEDDVQFIRSSAPGPGQSSGDPIVLSDSPVREDGPSSSTDMSGSLNNRSVLLDFVAGLYPPPSPLQSLHYHNAPVFPQPAPTSSLYQLPSVPHLEYQIRLSFPPSMVVRPTPIYPRQLDGGLDFVRFDAEMLNAAAFASSTGASQKLIEECSVKTRFIKRIPSKSKTVQAKRQTPKCPICLEDFVDKVKIRRLRCIHNFHIKCIDQWLRKNAICPVCRKSIITK